MKRVIVFSSMICALFALSCKDNANQTSQVSDPRILLKDDPLITYDLLDTVGITQYAIITVQGKKQIRVDAFNVKRRLKTVDEVSSLVNELSEQGHDSVGMYIYSEEEMYITIPEIKKEVKIPAEIPAKLNEIFTDGIDGLKVMIKGSDKGLDGVEKEVQDVLSENVRNVLIVVE